MFGLIGGLVKATVDTAAGVTGLVTGTVMGVAHPIVANTLDITVGMVKRAIEDGCESYDDIRDYYDLD